MLTAIPTLATETCTTLVECEGFITRHQNRQRNIYYSVNPTRRPMDKKAAKGDIAAAEFVWADCDPRDDERPRAAKKRYRATLDALLGAGQIPPPSFEIDSGNGFQFLWRLTSSVAFPAGIEKVEAVNKGIMEAVGCEDTSTFNADRILRVPGSTNFPSERKVELGRVECSARSLASNDGAWDLSAFPKAATEGPRRGKREAADIDELERTIADGGQEPDGKNRHGATKSESVWWVCMAMLKRGYAQDTIIATLLNRNNGVSEHIYEQRRPAAYAERQVKQAMQKLDFKNNPVTHAPTRNSPLNVRIALAKLGVTLRFNRFSQEEVIEGLAGFTIVRDEVVGRLRSIFELEFHFSPPKDLVFEVLTDVAWRNNFHPVIEYLDGLKWDGVPRIDQWLVTYGGAESTEYTRAVGSITLIAAVRRVRRPGCKFDEMLVLENPEQGTNKSTAVQMLAVREEWFSDDLPLFAKGREMIEAQEGCWIIEYSDMVGFKSNRNVDHMKAVLSRQRDKGRPAYGRKSLSLPRQSIVIGTTNNSRYFVDPTGNRRIWPVMTKRFDLKSLERDRDQLWAEAAHREAAGESIRLDEGLWRAAGLEQEKRLIDDPWVDEIEKHLGEFTNAKISAADAWLVVGKPTGQRTQVDNERFGAAMKVAGWVRPKRKKVWINGRPISGYVRGEQPWKALTVTRSRQDGEDHVFVDFEHDDDNIVRLDGHRMRRNKYDRD